jgi:hypothetical protein
LVQELVHSLTWDRAAPVTARVVPVVTWHFFFILGLTTPYQLQ